MGCIWEAQDGTRIQLDSMCMKFVSIKCVNGFSDSCKSVGFVNIGFVNIGFVSIRFVAIGVGGRSRKASSLTL